MPRAEKRGAFRISKTENLLVVLQGRLSAARKYGGSVSRKTGRIFTISKKRRHIQGNENGRPMAAPTISIKETATIGLFDSLNTPELKDSGVFYVTR